MAIFKTAKQFLKKVGINYDAYFFKRRVSRSDCLRIIVGSGGINRDGWISTDIDILNLLEIRDWQKSFKIGSVDTVLAEHVWEHLTESEASIAVRNCFKFLKSGGHLRIAVPDGNHPDPDYIAYVRPGGTGFGSDDHKILYNYKTLAGVLEHEGFAVKLLEWFDENGDFHFEEWSPEDGMVRRSMRFDKRNKSTPLAYTSLIIDGYKPA